MHIRDSYDLDYLSPPEGVEQEFADGERVLAGGFGKFAGHKGTVNHMSWDGTYTIDLDEPDDYGKTTMLFSARDLVPLVEHEPYEVILQYGDRIERWVTIAISSSNARLKALNTHPKPLVLNVRKLDRDEV